MREALVGGVPTQGALALTYLIVFGSLAGYTAYYWLLRNAPISLVATYAYVNPIVAVLLGWALLSEPVTSTVLLGGGLAVLGVLLVVSTERHGRRREERADAPGEPAAGAAPAPSPPSVSSSRTSANGPPTRPAEVPCTGR